MAEPPQVLVTYKKSRYTQWVLEERNAAVAKLIEANDPSVARLQRAHEAHEQSLNLVIEALLKLGVAHDVRYRGELESVEGYGLIVAVGGDGTVLDLSHRISQTPVLAINSDPEGSIGYFCAGTAPDARALLERTLSGQWAPLALRRLRLVLNGVPVAQALNDVLVCQSNPAAVSSYLLRVGDVQEAQRSSGVWISTPAGSTGAIRSAGGEVQPLDDDQFQYLVREPYPLRQGDYQLGRGRFVPEAPFELISRMHEGRLYLDGPHSSYRFDIGDRLQVDGQAPPLRLYGDLQARR